MREFKFRAWYEPFKKMYGMKHLGIGVFTDKDYLVMQYTGLKDCDGVEIYENDVIHVKYNLIGEITVVFENGAFNIAKYDLSKCEIIGNIYERSTRPTHA